MSELEGSFGPAPSEPVPFLPKVLVLMSVPLFFGYLIKHFLLPRPVFLVMYTWAILSFVTVPVLCLVECVVLAKLAQAGTGRPHVRARTHLLALGVGLAGLTAAFLVRSYG